MKLVLHIGTEKTATSTIQEFLYLNRQVLAEHGIALSDYLGIPNNRKLAAYCMPPDIFDSYLNDRKIYTVEQKAKYFASFLDDFESEIKGMSSSAEKMIITSEHFHSRLTSRESILKLKDILDNFFTEIKIICYFREQSAVVKSLYSTSIKVGEYQNFEDFSRRVSPKNHYYNYFTFFMKWSEIFGKECLIPRLFHKATWRDGDIRKDFISMVDDKLTMEDFDYSLPDTNKSLGLTGIELGKINNRINPMYDENGNRNTWREKISTIIESSTISEIGEIYFPNATTIHDSFSESNIAFAREFLGSDLNPFSKPKTNANDPAYNNPLSVFHPVLFQFFENLLIALNEIPRIDSKHAVKLRDIAIKISKKEELNIIDARNLMEIACQIRPEGKFIRDKLIDFNRQATSLDYIETQKSHDPYPHPISKVLGYIKNIISRAKKEVMLI